MTKLSGRSLAFENLEDRKLPAVFMVSSLADSGSGTLREAITAANGSTEADEIQFSVTGQINLATGLPQIVRNLTITGPGSNLLTINAGHGTDGLPATDDGFRVFDIDNGATGFLEVAISDLTLTGGDQPLRGGAIRSLENLRLTECTISGNSASDEGGGVFERYGALTISDCTIRDNITIGDRNDGAGVSALQATVIINNSLIANNSTDEIDANGGGIAIRDGNLSINNSTLSGNSVTGGGADGGGIYARDTEVSINSSLITGNFTNGQNADGGGIFVRAGNLFLRNSTVCNNSALFDNTINDNPSTGGGISVSPNPELAQAAWIINSTVSGNRVADGAGGGLFVFSGNIHVIKSTFTNNEAPMGGGIASRSTANVTTKLSSSIISGNIGGDVDHYKYSSNDPEINTFVSGGYNLIGSGNALDNFLSTDQLEVNDPLLGPLAANGSATPTHAILPGSPVLDAGSSGLTQDQRGLPMPVDLPDVANRDGSNGSDAGAYEAQRAPSADFDGDGDVDGRDFLLWQRGYGKSTDAQLSDGNSDDDGDTDVSDLAAWQVAYGSQEIEEESPILGLVSGTRSEFSEYLTANLIDAAFLQLAGTDFSQESYENFRIALPEYVESFDSIIFPVDDLLKDVDPSEHAGHALSLKTNKPKSSLNSELGLSTQLSELLLAQQ
jgi:hypothetical protein